MFRRNIGTYLRNRTASYLSRYWTLVFPIGVPIFFETTISIIKINYINPVKYELIGKVWNNPIGIYFNILEKALRKFPNIFMKGKQCPKLRASVVISVNHDAEIQ